MEETEFNLIFWWLGFHKGFHENSPVDGIGKQGILRHANSKNQRNRLERQVGYAGQIESAADRKPKRKFC